jgi:arsenate reductase (thioredoxin)
MPAGEDGHAPIVVFLCVHNAGRSQMALGWLTRLAAGRAIGRSGGSEPAGVVNPVAVTAMHEVGIDISSAVPTRWTAEALADVDLVVTMGCGEECPVVPGASYEDWPVDDPAGRELAEVRVIRDEIEQRVRELLVRLTPRTGSR